MATTRVFDHPEFGVVEMEASEGAYLWVRMPARNARTAVLEPWDSCTTPDTVSGCHRDAKAVIAEVLAGGDLQPVWDWLEENMIEQIEWLKWGEGW